MAFEKRTWLARIGAGLNKFIIGEKDAGGKQTLTNSPDSVTQTGDMISADNLNDLEDRIDNEFTSQNTRINAKQDTLTFDNVPTSGSNNPVKSGGIYTTIEGMKLTKVWENPSPSAVFPAQTVSFAGVGEIIIAYSLSESLRGYYHIKVESGASISLASGGRLSKVTVTSDSFTVWGRSFGVTASGGSTQLSFGDGYVFSLGGFGGAIRGSIISNNLVLVPLEIYSVGDIYNS